MSDMSDTLACGHEPTPTYYTAGTRVTVGDSVITMTGDEILFPGYGTDPDTGERFCYPCAGARERSRMARSSRFVAYLSTDGRRVTDWPGNELGRVTSSHDSRAARKTYVSVTAWDGSEWYGVGPLESGTYVTLRRRASSPIPCAYASAAHHSRDRVEVFSGRRESVILCGYHASDEWRPVALAAASVGGAA